MIVPMSSHSPTGWWHFSEVKYWHFLHTTWLRGFIFFSCFPLQLHWSMKWLDCCIFLTVYDCFVLFFWTRIIELFCPGPISPHWGVLSKCLAYSKAASDPFVYSLLRHQYRKTCSHLANKVLKRSPLNSSSRRVENSTGRNDNNSTTITTNNITNIQPLNNKPPIPWRSPLLL